MKIRKLVVLTLSQCSVDNEKQEQDIMSPLHSAAYFGQLEIIKLILEFGEYVDPILTGGKMHGFTPLYLAVQNKHLDCVRFLLHVGASVNPKIEGIYHPIHYAVFNNSVNIAKELLQHGADANVRFDNNFFEKNLVKMERSLWLDHNLPLFHYSILQKHQKMLKVLSPYTDKNLKTSLGKTALMQAVDVNNKRWVTALVTKENVNDKDSFGQPVLHFTMVNANRKASMYSKKEFELRRQRLSVVRCLVEKGADVNARFPENNKYSAIIHYMVRYGFYEGVIYLLYRCIKLNFNDIDPHIFSLAYTKYKDLTPDIRNNNTYLCKIHLRLRESIYYIVKKTIDLQMIGVPVNEDLILKHPPFKWITFDKYIQEMNTYKIDLMKQINYMKESNIGDTNITIWDLLTCKTNKLVKLMSIKSVRDYDPLGSGWKNILNYSRLLEERLCNAKKRKLYIQETSEIIFSILNIKYLIPFDCCEQIANFL